MGRPAEALQDFESSVELSEAETGEAVNSMVDRLEAGREELEEAMQWCEPGTTFEAFFEMEKCFTRAMSLTKQEKWPEAEVLFRQLTESGNNIPQYWGNLGVCLMMQSRFDEAEEALKHSLAIDPDYPIARDNLKKLPEVRRSKRPIGLQLINAEEEENDRQSLTLFEKDEEGNVTSTSTIAKFGHTMTGTWKKLGKQAPRYDLFLNVYQDARFFTCPRCEIRTQSRKFTLVITLNPNYTAILDKTCRFCQICNLLIVHQDELEDLLARHFEKVNPEVVGKDYLVMGTLDRTEWNKGKQGPLSFELVKEYLHDFEEVVTFERVSR